MNYLHKSFTLSVVNIKTILSGLITFIVAKRNISLFSSHISLEQPWKYNGTLEFIYTNDLKFIVHTATALLSSPVKNAKSDSLGRLKMILWISDDKVGVV